MVRHIKTTYAPDDGAAREHNAKSGSLGFGTLHYALLANLRPDRVLAIGSRYGYIPSILALWARVRVDFVDANFSGDAAREFGGVGHWTEERFAEYGGRVTTHRMLSADFFKTHHDPYGYVYIDADHSYDGAFHDFSRALQVLEPGGLITLHDAVVERFGIMKLVAALDPVRFGVIIIHKRPGLAIVQPR